MIPSAPVLLIVTEFVLFETKAPFATFTPFLPVFVIVVFPYELLILPFTTMPSLPEFVTNNSPFLLFNNPVEAIKTPDPVLSTNNLPFWLINEPETFTAPLLFTSNVSPFPLIEFPATLIPLEPELLISILPLPKFFMDPAILVPPSLPYDFITILPLSFEKPFAGFRLSVFTSLLNKFSACIFERIFVESFTPAIISALSVIFTLAALISIAFLAKTFPSTWTVPVPGTLSLDS